MRDFGVLKGKQSSYLLILLLITSAGVWCQTVPCYNEVLINSQVSVDSSQDLSNLPIDLSNDTDLPAVTQFGISGWISNRSSFLLDFLVKVLSTDATELKYLEIDVGDSTSSQIGISSNYSLTTGDLSAKFTLSNPWSFVFISLQAGSQICLDVLGAASFVPATNRVCINMAVTPTSLSFETMRFVLSATTTLTVATQTILFHRNYSLPDELALLMLMRSDTTVISEYLFSQSSLSEFLVDNLDVASNNVNTKFLTTSQTPLLFDKGLVFETGNYITFAEFTMTPITNEFTLSFSLQTSVTSSSVSEFPLFEMFSTTSNDSLLKITLLYIDIFYVQAKITIQGVPAPVILSNSPCYVNRITSWNQFLISGYSYATVDSASPPSYYLEFSINSVFCQKVTSTSFKPSSNSYKIQFGDTTTAFDDTFSIKAVRIYSGSYSPIYSTCNSRCPIMQRREHTPAEIEKLSANAQGLTFTSATPAMNVLTLNSTLSLACLQCASQKYFMDEYCVEGASSCTKFLDIKSTTCIPYQDCQNPLNNPTDCVNNCEPTFAIGTSGACSVPCHYSCSSCDSTGSCLTTGCPSTRQYDSSGICICKSSTSSFAYFDDGQSLDCLVQAIPAVTLPTQTASPIQGIFDINVNTSGTKSVAALNSAWLFGSGGTITYPSTSSQQPTADLVSGILLKSTQNFKISGFTSFNTIRFWINPSDQLGRPSTLLKMISETTPTDILFSLGINTYDGFRSSIKICFFQRCMLASPKKLYIQAQKWSLLTISLNDSENEFIATVFLNAYKAQTAIFEKFKLASEQFNPNPSSAQNLQYSIQFGDQLNQFAATGSYIALRYISFFKDQVTLVNEFGYPATDNCAMYSGTLCLLCLKGYRFISYKGSTCELDTTTIAVTTPTQFYYENLRMVHDCALDINFCTECMTTPIICSNCISTRENPSLCPCKAGTYSDANDICQNCNPVCSTCTAYSQCTTCATGRTTIPTCPCPDGYFTMPGASTCTACDFSCVSCDPNTAFCTCPNLATTFRMQSVDNLTCPCQSGYFDPKDTSKICKQCFSNCLTCLTGEEDKCYSCKISANETNGLQITGGTIGECLCSDTDNYYLNYSGQCEQYVTAKFSIEIMTNSRVPRLKIELSKDIERHDNSRWADLLDFEVVAYDSTTHKRILSSSTNLVLSTSNHDSLTNVGYVYINVQNSVRVTYLHVKILSYKAVRSLSGVPLQKSYTGDSFTFSIEPFIFNFDSSDLSTYQSQQEMIQTLQDSQFVGFLRSTSILLFLGNFMQSITSLVFLQTTLPIRPYLLICQFASFLFPHTPAWLEKNVTLPPSIYGASLQVEGLDYASYIFKGMGITSNFLINITETFVLFFITGLGLIVAKVIDAQREKKWPVPEIKLSFHVISFSLNLVEVRLIYILLSMNLQLYQPGGSSALSIISSIFVFIFLIAFFYLTYLTRQILNSEEEKEEFKYARTAHLIQFIEYTKHSLLLNYKIIQFAKKYLYFLILIMFQNYPKTVIILSLVLSIATGILDIITRPFKIKWISYGKILSSLTWISIWIIILAAHMKYQEMTEQNYLIDTDLFSSFQTIGNFLFYAIIIYASLHLIILVLKVIDVLHQFYLMLAEKKKNEIIYLCDQLKEDGQYQQVQLAFINLDKSDDTNNIFHKRQPDQSDKDLSSKDKYLFNFKQSNLVKPVHKKVL